MNIVSTMTFSFAVLPKEPFQASWLGVTRRDQEGKRKGEKVNEEEDKGTVALH